VNFLLPSERVRGGLGWGKKIRTPARIVISARNTVFNHQVDRRRGEEFEEFLACCFRDLGYAVEMTPKMGDFGADLILSKGARKALSLQNAIKEKWEISPCKKWLVRLSITGRRMRS
jgi:hypothetical protein